jgi:arylformamidase
VDPEVSLTLEQSDRRRRAPANVSRLDFGLHTGTHVDAPVHFIVGAPGAEELPLDVLVGPAVVVVEAPDLEGRHGAAGRR